MLNKGKIQFFEINFFFHYKSTLKSHSVIVKFYEHGSSNNDHPYNKCVYKV
jgi:hypothetical protein